MPVVPFTAVIHVTVHTEDDLGVAWDEAERLAKILSLVVKSTARVEAVRF